MQISGTLLKAKLNTETVRLITGARQSFVLWSDRVFVTTKSA